MSATLQDLAAELQRLLGQADLLLQPQRAQGDFSELLLWKRQNLKIKIYGDTTHGRPHVHVDYGRQHHAASFALDNPEMIVGDLLKAHQREVISWITKHRSQLMEIWTRMQAGEDPTELVASLDGENAAPN